MKKILFLLLMVVVALAIAPLFLPKTLYAEEEYVFEADISTVFENFYDFKQFTQLNEWTQDVDNVELHFSSPSAGTNAYYTWQSNLKEIGEGKMQITDSKLEEFIEYDLTFGELEGNTAEVIFQELEGGKTKVIWSFESAAASYPFQVYNYLMKGTVKKQLHKSLHNLDSLLQTKNNHQSPFIVKRGINKKMFGVIQSTAIDSEEIDTAIAETLGLVKSYLRDKQNITEEQIGEPVVYWKLYDLEQNASMFYAGYFINHDVPEEGDMESVDLSFDRVLKGLHKGDYRNLPNTYEAMRVFADNKELNLSTEWYNVYVKDMKEVEMPSNLRTEIYIPIID